MIHPEFVRDINHQRRPDLGTKKNRLKSELVSAKNSFNFILSLPYFILSFVGEHLTTAQIVNYGNGTCYEELENQLRNMRGLHLKEIILLEYL